MGFCFPGLRGLRQGLFCSPTGSAGRPRLDQGGSTLHPPALTPSLSPPGDTRPLPARSPAYLPGLQLLREKWGQGQAEVREQAHGNGVERTRAIPPPRPPPDTQAEAGSCLSMHKARPLGCWRWGEAVGTRAKSRARRWGAGVCSVLRV